MAAPLIVFSKAWHCKTLAGSKRIYTHLVPVRYKQTQATCTYVVLPEVPPDTAETNTLMKVDSLPNWPEVNPSSVYRACAKLSILYDTKLAEHSENLSDFSKPRQFDAVYNPIEEVSVPLNTAYKHVKHLSLVKRKSFADPFEGIYKHVKRGENEKWSNEILLNSMKELKAGSHKLSEEQVRVVDLYLREGQQAGVGLKGSDLTLYRDLNKGLINAQDDFRRKVFFASQIYEETVFDKHAMSEMPLTISRKLSLDKKNPDDGPWKVSVASSAIYRPLLTYCPDRGLRERIWTNRYRIASVRSYGSSHLQNKKNIDTIRLARSKLAQIFGYSSYAQMAMENRMAGSVENVMEMIETLRSAFRPEAGEELASLQKFSKSHGFKEKLRLWDIAYWSRRQVQDLYEVDLNAQSQYFPFPKVLDGLFQICNVMFGIVIKKKEDGSVPVWHPSVQVYEVFDESGEMRGTFYLDAFTCLGEKYGGSWVGSSRPRSTQLGLTPVSFIYMNLSPTIGRQPPLMSVKDVIELFSMMGHILQQVVTTVDYSEIAGQSNIEWDALHIPMFVLQMWLKRTDTLRSLSSHWQTGEQLDNDSVQNILNATSHMSSNHLMKSLFDSVYDLEMHLSNSHWETAMSRLWGRYIPHDIEQHYSEPTGRTDIFTDNKQAAGLYASLWAEMAAADIVKSLSMCGSLEDLKDTGRRFKRTFLELGGSVPASEVFRRFKGHDPSISSLVEHRMPNKENKS